MHKCTERERRIERLREWEADQRRKYGPNWEHNPDRPVSIIMNYPPPFGVTVVASGIHVNDKRLTFSEWLAKIKSSQHKQAKSK